MGPFCPHCGEDLKGLGVTETTDDDDDDDDGDTEEWTE